MPVETVLVVDDEPVIASLCAEALRKEGFTVETAYPPAAALTRLQSQHFDLLLVDIMMPEMNGLDLMEKARSLQPDLVVVIITGQGTLDAAIRAITLGANGFLLKPFRPVELRKAVEDALQKVRLLRENQRLHALFPLLATVAQLATATEEEKLLRVVCEQAGRHLGADLAWMLIVPERETSRLHAWGREPIAPKLKETLQAIAALALQRRTPLAPDTAKDSSVAGLAARSGVSDYLCVPLSTTQGEPLGVLGIGQMGHAHAFQASDLHTLTLLAEHTRTTLENLRLYHALRSSFLDTVAALANALEARDWGTRAHCQRLASLAQPVGARLGMDDDEVHTLRLAALLHDIGKIGVRDNILLKPGPLHSEEWHAMRQHAEIGAAILGDISGLRPLVPIIRHHHERVDGGGYPDGLRQDAIPLGARIVAAVDTYCAMTENRPYRAALPRELALDQLRSLAGTQLDREVAETVIKVVGDLP